MEVDLDLQGAIEVTLHKDLLVLVPEGALCEQGFLLLLSQSHPGGNAQFYPLLQMCRQMLAKGLCGGKSL